MPDGPGGPEGPGVPGVPGVPCGPAGPAGPVELSHANSAALASSNPANRVVRLNDRLMVIPLGVIECLKSVLAVHCALRNGIA